MTKETKPTVPVIDEVVRQHAEMAAFLWAQRHELTRADPVDHNAVRDVERRLEANLDGLRIAGEAAWPFALMQFEDTPEKGELFLLSVLAIEGADADRIARVVEFGRACDDSSGLEGAIGWLPAKMVAPLVRDWIHSKDAFKRFLAVSGCVSHQVDPKVMLATYLRDPDPRVRGQAFRLTGVLQRQDLIDELRIGIGDRDETARGHAAAALAQFGGDALATAELKKVAVAGGPQALAALRAVVQAGPEKNVRAWLAELLRSPGLAHLGVRGAGMLGRREILPWLIQQMRIPPLAETAGISFLELFPEARDDHDLFSGQPDLLGNLISEHFEGDPPYLPVADRVQTWAKSKGLE